MFIIYCVKYHTSDCCSDEYSSSRTARALFRDVRFGQKVSQIDPTRDKSETFSDNISLHFGAPKIHGFALQFGANLTHFVAQNVLKSDLIPFMANLTHFAP